MPNRALVIVDVQRGFLDPSSMFAQASRTPLTPDEVARLRSTLLTVAATARRHGVPVIHVMTSFDAKYSDSALAPMWRSVFNKGSQQLVVGSWSEAIFEPSLVKDADYVVRKTGHSAFQHTGLDRLLRNLDVTEVFLAGGAVAGCLADTSNIGVSLGYEHVLIADAVYPVQDPFFQAGILKDQFRSIASAHLEEALKGGATRPNPDAARTALIAVDVQECFIGSRGLAVRRFSVSVEKASAIRSDIATAIAVARNRHVPVVFVSTVRVPGVPPIRAEVSVDDLRLIPASGAPIDYVTEAHPTSSEAALIKPSSGAFGATALDVYLRYAHVSKCVLVGGDTAGVSSLNDTMRVGVGLGYDMVMVGDTAYSSTGYGRDLINRRGSTILLEGLAQEL